MFSALSETFDLYRLLDTANKDPRAIAFYSEKDIYFQYFEGYIHYLQKHSDLHIYYITSDPNDRAFKIKRDRFHPFYLNRLAPKAIENLKTKAIVMTVQELEKSFLKRSRFGANHIFVCHSMCSMHLNYKKGDLDHYDSIFCVGPYQTDEIRTAETLYGLKKKTLVECGYWWVENLFREGQRTPSDGSILIAPSWHPGNFFETGIEEALVSLSTLGVPVILRPHPEFAKRFPKKIESLQKQTEATQNIRFETELGKHTSVLNAALLVTDWSGISLEYAIGLERPVLFINSPPRVDNPHYRDIPLIPIEYALRGGVLGETIEMNEMTQLGKRIQQCLQNQSIYREKLEGIRKKYLFNWLQSDKAGGNFLLSLFQENT